jgi:hypothetical protein
VHAAFHPGPYSLSPVAETGERFTDLSPYVAAINNGGGVAFQASLQEGGSGVYVSDGNTIATIVESGDGLLREVCSHPDLNSDRAACFYGELDSGDRAVLLARDGTTIILAGSAGPLGPTMNEAGAVAFRAENGTFGDGILRGADGHVASIAACGTRFKQFHGLPVIDDTGSVTFRADLASGGEGIYVGDAECVRTIVETGDTFTSLGLFPIRNSAGFVAFCASLQAGRSGVFVAVEGEVETVVDTSGPFESVRGVLLDAAGRIVFYATPRGGTLGVFSGPDPVAGRLLAVGSPLLGSTVAELALNPVSINDAGQLAIRVALTDRRQLVLRADPGSETVMGTD